MIKMKGLGRGLDALLSGSDAKPEDELRNLPVERLKPGKYQPRTHMDQDSLAELAASIKAQGVMQPILVRAVNNTPGAERYEIVAGERRWRASQLAGLSEVPVLVRSIPDEQALAMALIENIQRENLNPLEEAQGLQRLIDEFGLTHQQAADAVGRSRPAASNLLRLLQLSAPVQELLMTGKLDMGHARALLPLTGAQQVAIAQRIVQKGLSVREAERLVQQITNPPKTSSEKPVDRDLLRLQENLADGLGANVQIRTNKKGAGKVTIEFGSLDQLDGLISRLSV
ncbi:ParB/RepB/Spo0J family partition protein [Ferribacterium limneticum]|uniref:ParB/RepB/Spo0J family partition protein n=1 Tax=Ferribacterium limneticum TaxID=76259 RepID=UPI001CFB5FD0|nr:ParB/RepB/Spo0J family partition protein [Ferribacterium limneticum]UCV28432.1 ParB/RepB/Spo0J family partition protein [Ferribacterium limneticum]UCV32349.1 ParB/RepB/Spo0J family partition protein [Ferribacterium limneticum]